MKRALLIACAVAACAALGPPAPAAPAIVAKTVSGPITSERLDLVITAEAPCDATKEQFPDNSRLVSDAFSLKVDESGVGWFTGAVRILGPDSRPLFAGVLHGAAGILAPGAADCKAPGHLQGVINAAPAPDGTVAPRPAELFLSVDAIPESASPVPMYRGRLTGLIAFPPPAPAVTIASARAEYKTTEQISAIIANKSASAVRTWDGESYCTIVRLERQTSAGWTLVAGCVLAKAAMPVDIPAGSTKTVLLPPTGSDVNRVPGAYRVSLKYVALDTTGTPEGEFAVVSSEPFQVVAPPPPTGAVVSTSKLAYAPDEPITGVVANASAVPVIGYSFYSYCTFLQLQMKAGEGWKVIGPCMLTGGPSVTIKPGESKTVILPPAGSTFPAREPGVYRLAFPYAADATGSTASATVYSPEFLVVRPPTPTLRLAPDKPAYGVIDPITAILANGPSPVRIFDEQSFCTIVQLYRKEGDQWTLFAPCPLDRIPLPVTLKAGEVRRVTLAMNSLWPAGLYRLAVTFAELDSAGNAGPDQTVTTAAFSVGPTTTSSGKVLLAPTQLLYGENARITGVIRNDTAGPILVQDERSYCTILTLQKKDGDAWRMVAGCPLARVPITVTIPAGAKVPVPLPPLTTTVVKNEPGIYRLVLDYTTAPKDGAAGETVQVISPEFTVFRPTGTVRPVIF